MCWSFNLKQVWCWAKDNNIYYDGIWLISFKSIIIQWRYQLEMLISVDVCLSYIIRVLCLPMTVNDNAMCWEYILSHSENIENIWLSGIWLIALHPLTHTSNQSSKWIIIGLDNGLLTSCAPSYYLQKVMVSYKEDRIEWWSIKPCQNPDVLIGEISSD